MPLVFGPVSSRRFGLSLGLDLSGEAKQCNFDCVYCELSPKKPQAKQIQSPDVGQILNEVKAKIQSGVSFDFITLTANGEPSLYPHLKELIAGLKALKTGKKLLILSNGTAVLNEKAYEALLALDVVKFSLDSVVEKSFFRIDRAIKSINLAQMIQKMAEFGKEFKGELVMEVLVVKDLNDTELEFRALNEAFKHIKPSRIDLSSIDRPPAYPVRGVSFEKLAKLSHFIDAAPCVIASRHYEAQRLDLSEEELLKMLRLRAQSEFDIEAKFSPKSLELLQSLLTKGQAYTQNLAGVRFYRA